MSVDKSQENLGILSWRTRRSLVALCHWEAMQQMVSHQAASEDTVRLKERLRILFEPTRDFSPAHYYPYHQFLSRIHRPMRTLSLFHLMVLPDCEDDGSVVVHCKHFDRRRHRRSDWQGVQQDHSPAA